MSGLKSISAFARVKCKAGLLIPSCVQKGKNISGKNQKDAGSRLADDPKKQDRPCRDDDYLR
jgi:hypothetical protein